MRLSEFANTDPEGFARFCATLRDAGVTKLGPLELGPLPPAARSGTKADEDPNAEAMKKHRIMFAACRSVPPFEPRTAPSATPRAVANRRAHEAADGTTITKR